MLTAELDLEKLVQAVTDVATELVGAEFGSFFHNIVNEKGESYMLYTLSGAPREAFAKFPMPRNTALFGPTFRGEDVVRCEDVTKDPRYGKNPPYHGMPKGICRSAANWPRPWYRAARCSAGYFRSLGPWEIYRKSRGDHSWDSRSSSHRDG